MKAVCFGLRYSPNLGDGVIADCLAWGLRHHVPDVDVTLVDLSGRTDFVIRESRLRRVYLALQGVLPGALRAQIIKYLMGRKLDAQAEQWRATVNGADLVSIGGGQIFSDADLNFPSKLGRIADLVAESDVPAVVFAVGVARNWSPEGTRLFSRLTQANLRFVGARDPYSVDAWSAQMTGGPPPLLTPDPGLLAERCYGPVPADSDQSDRVGLCVTDPSILAHHADQAIAGHGSGGVRGFFEALVAALIERGHRLCLFTNGAFEDRAFLARLSQRPTVASKIADGTIRVAPDPVRPRDLAHLIGGLKAVIAHRLHANIIAYAYRRPMIGLSWDRKLESFFHSVALPENFFGLEPHGPDDVCNRLDSVLGLPHDDAKHRRVTADALASVGAMLSAAGLPEDAAA